MSERVFRQQALDAQRRIDHLPSAMRVTTGLTRGAMALLAALLCGATAWSAFVVAPVQIDGTGFSWTPPASCLTPCSRRWTG